jgi:hypothetical protein
MSAPARLHNRVPSAIRQEADGILHAPGAFDSPHGRFEAAPDGRAATMHRLFRRGEAPPTRCLRRWAQQHLGPRAALEALIVRPATPRGQRRARLLGDRLRRRVAFPGDAPNANRTHLGDPQEVGERVTLLLATVSCFRLFCIVRTWARSRRPGVPQWGEGEVASVLSRASSAAHASAVRAGSRSCAATAGFSAACNRGLHVFACAWDLPHSCPCSSWIGWCGT